MADWTKPDGASNYSSGVHQVNREKDDHLAKMDFTGDTNLPTGAIRWSSTNSRWEIWSGAAWGVLVSKYMIDVDTVDGKHADSTANNLLVLDANARVSAAKIGTGVVSDAEFGYLDGVTSAIQTQINAKQATITGGATSITASNLTASRALASDASGKVAISSVTSTELGYVSGVTSAIQTQINNTSGKRGALVYRTTAQSIANSTTTNISFPTESYDTSSIHDTVTNTSRLTVPAGVTKVRISGGLRWEGVATGTRVVGISKNGLTTAPGLPVSSITPDATTPAADHYVTTAILSVTAGDYFELFCLQTSGGALESSNGNYNPWFCMEIIQ